MKCSYLIKCYKVFFAIWYSHSKSCWKCTEVVLKLCHWILFHFYIKNNLHSYNYFFIYLSINYYTLILLKMYKWHFSACYLVNYNYRISVFLYPNWNSMPLPRVYTLLCNKKTGKLPNKPIHCHLQLILLFKYLTTILRIL